MKVEVYKERQLDLSKSDLNNLSPSPSLDKVVFFSGVGVFDDNGKILPLISDYLSYEAKYERIAFSSAGTYGRNLCYFLQYIRSRHDYDSNEMDDVFLTIPGFVIREYFTYLAREEGIKSGTIRNRDAIICAFIKYLCSPNEDRPALRDEDPYRKGLISKPPKKEPVISCNLDELYILIESTTSERERSILQFLYDSGLRRIELTRVTLQDIQNISSFDKQEFIAKHTDTPVNSYYLPLYVHGAKGRRNETKPRYTLITEATLKRIKKYHSSPLYKKHARKIKKASDTPAFFNAEGSKFTPSAISKLLERVSERAIKKGQISKSISAHKLRHGNAYSILQSTDEGKDYLDRLVRVQKNFGHTNITTTEMYTSIPQDIYNSMCDEKGELLTRSEKMKRLVEMTQLKIGIRAIK